MVEVFTIRDEVAKKCGDLFLVPNVDVAKRGFRQAMKNVIDPHDYVLVKVGEMDESTGQLFVTDIYVIPYSKVEPKLVTAAEYNEDGTI